MKKNLIIIGASGHGKVVADIAEKTDKWENIYFLDDNHKIKTCLNHKVIDVVDNFYKYKENSNYFVAIGDNKTREKITTKLEEKKVSIVTLIHPQAIVAKKVEIKLGTVVMAGVVINSDTTIGRGCIINTSSSIDHDNNIGDFTHISPGVHLAGNVEIGNRCWLGIGCVVVNNLRIINESNIRARSLIRKNIEVAVRFNDIF